MMLVPLSKSFTMSDNYDIASWLTYNADDIRQSLSHTLKCIADMSDGLIGHTTVKATVMNNLKRIIAQDSGLPLATDDILFAMEDPGVLQIIELYYIDPIMREVNNETH
jgi:hypothetical protein